MPGTALNQLEKSGAHSWGLPRGRYVSLHFVNEDMDALRLSYSLSHTGLVVMKQMQTEIPQAPYIWQPVDVGPSRALNLGVLPQAKHEQLC